MKAVKAKPLVLFTDMLQAAFFTLAALSTALSWMFEIAASAAKSALPSGGVGGMQYYDNLHRADRISVSLGRYAVVFFVITLAFAAAKFILTRKSSPNALSSFYKVVIASVILSASIVFMQILLHWWWQQPEF